VRNKHGGKSFQYEGSLTG